MFKKLEDKIIEATAKIPLSNREFAQSTILSIDHVDFYANNENCAGNMK